MPFVRAATVIPRDSGSWLRLILVAFCALMVVGEAGAQTAKADPTDQEISNAISDELLLDPGVDHYFIEVTTEKGIVSLKGMASSLLDKERAERIAETKRGVRAVINRIRVKSTERTDSAIRADVQNALLINPAADSYDVEVQVDDGVVTLTGAVHSWHEKDLAEKLARSVTGVTDVKNRVTLHYPAERSDSEIAADVKSALRWDVLVDDALVDVKVDEGRVTLAGTVGSAAEKSRAIAEAWVNGVSSVDSLGLKVAEWTRTEALRGNKYADVTDTEIEEAVHDALARDPRVAQDDVDVDVVNGLVTLRGEVWSPAAKRAAASDARNTVGVWSVRNYVLVRPIAVGSDETIAERVAQALERNPYVRRYDVTIAVDEGVVTLSGSVDTSFDKVQAEDVVADLKGVKDVRNLIDVLPTADVLTYEPYVDELYPGDYAWYDGFVTSTSKDDWSILQAIQEELWWSPFVDSDEVVVTVEDGVATLTGTVDSWSERRAAAENALEGGAVRVINRLDLRYGPDV